MRATDEIESVAEPVLREFHPRPVEWKHVDPNRIVIRYDRPSDTLLVHLFGRGRPSVSVPIDRYLYLMVDPDSEEMIGIHVEGFLGLAVKEHPRQIEVLDYAELRGITRPEVQALQGEILGNRQAPAHGQGSAANSASGKARAAALLLGSEATLWGLPRLPVA